MADLSDDLRKFLEELQQRYFGPDAPKDATPPIPADALEALLKAAERGDKTQAQALVELAGVAEYWHDPEGTPWATVPVEGHTEHHPIRSRAFRRWLARRYFEQAGKPPSAQPMSDALTVLEGQALFAGGEYPAYVRVAGHEGRVYLDLADAAWRGVEITPDGWEIIPSERVPVRFRRGQGMLPLPEPSRGGSLTLLRRYLHLPSDADDDPAWVLLIAWLVGAYSPAGPYPVLDLGGEQGAGKSTAARVLRRLVDPNAVELRTVPREERDLAIACRHGWAIALDNVSGLAPWASDALCRLSTGGGLATRALYTDDEEALFGYTRPLILTSIEGAAARPDLLDRSLVVTLPPLPDGARKTEAELWSAFERDRPLILGALLDAVSTALRRLPDVKLDRLPRMADFARWVVAAEPALPWPEGTFLRVYEGNRRDAVTVALDADPVAVALRAWLPGVTDPTGERGRWSGTASDLLDALTGQVSEHTAKSPDWPKTGRGMSGRLRRLAPALRAEGIEVRTDDRVGKERTRLITLTWTPPAEKEGSARPSASSVRPPATSDGHSQADGSADGSGATVRQSSANRPPDKPHHDAQADGADGADGSLLRLFSDRESTADWPRLGETFPAVTGADHHCVRCGGKVWRWVPTARKWGCIACGINERGELAA